MVLVYVHYIVIIKWINNITNTPFIYVYDKPSGIYEQNNLNYKTA